MLEEKLRRISDYAPLARFERGDDVEVAKQLLEDMAYVAKGGVVATRGALYQYDDDLGVWVRLDENLITGLIHYYAGCAKGESGALRLSSGACEGIYKCTLRHPSIYKPAFFDDVGAGIACSNGYVTVTKDGVRLVPHSAEHRATSRIDIEYDVDADNEGWVALLDTLFDGCPDAQDRKFMLQEFVGACICGLATDYAKVMMLTGSGANGKSTFVEAIESLFPSESVVSVPPQRLKDDYWVMRLEGAMLNTVSEISDKAITDTERLKGAVTGDTISGRSPYGRPVEFKAKAGHLFSCNELPGTVDNSQGFWRRFLVVDFPRDFSKLPIKDQLSKGTILRGLKKYRAGMFAWALHGAVRLLRNGEYTHHEAHVVIMDEWRRDVDSVADFVASCTSQAIEPRPLSEIHASFTAWCEGSGRKPMSLRSLGKRLVKLGHERTKTRTGAHYPIEVLPKTAWADWSGSRFP